MKCPECNSNDVEDYTPELDDQQTEIWECNSCGYQFEIVLEDE